MVPVHTARTGDPARAWMSMPRRRPGSYGAERSYVNGATTAPPGTGRRQPSSATAAAGPTLPSTTRSVVVVRAVRGIEGRRYGRIGGPAPDCAGSLRLRCSFVADGYEVVVPEPPNHWFKSVFVGLVLLIGIGCLVVAITAGSWPEAVFGVVLIALATGALVLIRRGRNPRWMQGPLDRRAARRAGVEAPDTTPTMRQAVLVAASLLIVTFVLTALVDRPWAPLLGAVAVSSAWAVWHRRSGGSRTP
jgi:type IV secretory pathway TrbD component